MKFYLGAFSLCLSAVFLSLVALPPAVRAADSSAAPYIVVLKDSAGEPAAVAADHTRRYGVKRKAVYGSALNGYAGQIPADELSAVRSDRAVDFVVKDQIFSRMRPPQERPKRVLRCDHSHDFDQRQCLDDGMNRIDTDLSSVRAGDGHGKLGVNVAVIDSGIDVDHPDLNVAGGIDCSSGAPINSGPTGYDDEDGHGTFVAGVVGALDNKFGVVGVAPGTPLWSVRVEDSEFEISDSAAICGVDWVTSTRRDRNPSNDIAVANMSIGGPGTDDRNCGRSGNDVSALLHRAICRSEAFGVTYVAAAGNDAEDFASGGPDTFAIPASYDEVLTTTAMGDYDGRPGGRAAPDCYGLDYAQYGLDDQITSFSNFATRPPDRAHVIAAPGLCITSTYPTDQYPYGAGGSGTSFASPAVAGTAAVCIADGRCKGSPARIMGTLLDDAAAYNRAQPHYGYVGDPFRPIRGEYFGWLIWAGKY
jgi:subtilisin